MLERGNVREPVRMCELERKTNEPHKSRQVQEETWFPVIDVERQLNLFSSPRQEADAKR